MKIIFEAQTVLVDWYVQFPVEWTCTHLPRKGDNIVIKDLFPKNKSLLTFSQQSVADNAKIGKPNYNDYKGYLYDYEDAVYREDVYDTAIESCAIAKILRRGSYVVENFYWEKENEEIVLAITLEEV